jgi:ABC-2 type transport system permease protein
MWSVCKKELRQFFSSLTGYIAIIVFLLVNGLVLFVFEDNILRLWLCHPGPFFPARSLDSFIADPRHHHAQFC